MTRDSHAVFAVLGLIGFALVFWGSLFGRLKSAPPPGSTHGHWPPGPREWFTPTGYRARVVGFLFLSITVLEGLVRLALRYL